MLFQLPGVIRGDGASASDAGLGSTQIVTDQGLDTSKIPSTFTLDSDLMENQYIIEIDDRLGRIAKPLGGNGGLANANFIDDDRVASYYLSKTSNPDYFDDEFGPANTAEGSTSAVSAIAGPRGTRLKFSIRASLELNTSTSLFSRLGSTYTISHHGTFYYVDSTVRITGVTTGYRLDIPIRFIKLQST